MTSTATLTLQNTLKHRYGTSAYVNGHTYPIDDEGYAHEVDPVDAVKMLQGKAWRKINDPPTKESRAAKKAEIEARRAAEAEDEANAALEADEQEGDDELEAADDEEEEETEYPDPMETDDIDDLRKTADAYEIKYTRQTGKKRLVREIMAAMYPPTK